MTDQPAAERTCLPLSILYGIQNCSYKNKQKKPLVLTIREFCYKVIYFTNLDFEIGEFFILYYVAREKTTFF